MSQYYIVSMMRHIASNSILNGTLPPYSCLFFPMNQLNPWIQLIIIICTRSSCRPVFWPGNDHGPRLSRNSSLEICLVASTDHLLDVRYSCSRVVSQTVSWLASEITMRIQAMSRRIDNSLRKIIRQTWQRITCSTDLSLLQRDEEPGPVSRWW